MAPGTLGPGGRGRRRERVLWDGSGREAADARHSGMVAHGGCGLFRDCGGRGVLRDSGAGTYGERWTSGALGLWSTRGAPGLGRGQEAPRP